MAIAIETLCAALVARSTGLRPEDRAGYAAVGDDGFRPVVWGLGRTEEEAIENGRAECRAAECDSSLRCEELTAAQWDAIEHGDVSWPSSVPTPPKTIGGAS